jgi:hypothetical protein
MSMSFLYVGEEEREREETSEDGAAVLGVAEAE